MRTAREEAHGWTGCNGACCPPTHDHTTACAHNVFCDRLTAAIEARDMEFIKDHAAVRDERDAAEASLATLRALLPNTTAIAEERDAARRDLATARSALDIATAALVRLRGFPCRTCRRDADANHALNRLAALMPATGEPT